jgi:uncharacterized protein
MLQKSVPAWFEIPVDDLDRAQRFYEDLLETSLKREAMGPDMQMAVFPAEKPAPTGALVRHAGCVPSAAGTTVYLNLADVAATLKRVAKVGGEVLIPRTEIPGDMGFFAQIRDSEGNRVGLWSQV